METSEVKYLVEQCIEAFKRDELTEQDLQRIIEAIDSGAGKRQDLLYLQAHNTSVTSGLHGMSLVENGEVTEGPTDAHDWPYHSVLEAMRDGWRVI